MKQHYFKLYKNASFIRIYPAMNCFKVLSVDLVSGKMCLQGLNDQGQPVNPPTSIELSRYAVYQLYVDKSFKPRGSLRLSFAALTRE